MIARKDGFTLLELMVAAACLAIAVLGTVVYFHTSSTLQREGKGYTQATAAANGVVEYLTNLPFTDAYRGYHTAVYTQNPPNDTLHRSRDLAEFGVSLYGLGGADSGEPYGDLNNNDKPDWDDADDDLAWDTAEPPIDGGGTFTDLNGNGRWDPPERCLMIFVDNMTCTAFNDTNGDGLKQPTESFKHNPPVFWNDPDPFYDPSLSSSGFLCPRHGQDGCVSESIACDNLLRITVVARWVSPYGQREMRLRALRALR